MCEGYRNGANLTTLAEDLVELFLGGVEAHVAHVQRRRLKKKKNSNFFFLLI